MIYVLAETMINGGRYMTLLRTTFTGPVTGLALAAFVVETTLLLTELVPVDATTYLITLTATMTALVAHVAAFQREARAERAEERAERAALYDYVDGRFDDYEIDGLRALLVSRVPQARSEEAKLYRIYP
ncbi:hypothetical protein [Amycolatopsis thermoflava]|uniref:hypothetical protein n=1 Tax=Amycolatopsis thermoflava TaxID=84480 RepID=UPI0003FAFA23|nr:hypothetical protein [Amycolatopsis thermoflava]